VLAFSFLFKSFYFSDGRYQAAGGYTSPAILSALVIILLLVCSEIRTGIKTIFIIIQSLILIATGSRGVLIALIVIIALISMYNLVKAKSMGAPIGLKLIPNLLILFFVVGYFYIDTLIKYRSFEFLTLLNSDSASSIGTLGFRQNLFERMINEFQNFTLTEKFLGLGAGSGTSLAMNFISNLRDTNYTSGRVFHNGFLQLLIETGLVGIFLFIILILSTFNYRKSNGISGFGYIWMLFYLISLFFTSNPFATSGLLASLIYVTFLVPTFSRELKSGN
jgi:O-antigen ligase